MSKQELSGWQREISIAALPLAAVVAVLALAQGATFPNLPWHAGLIKPSFNPPNWLFGPVWTTLYGLMALAAWRILRLPESPERQTAITLFFTQLALNAAWSWMFFAANSTLLGLINIVPQFIAVVATTVAFARLDRLAGLAMAPLVLWVGYASALNAAIWWLNR